MRVSVSVLMVGLALSAVAAPAPRDLPETAEGTFVQRKMLADVDVTLVSKGTFRFGRDRFFEWNTREPMPSVFYATPTNYSLTVNGRFATCRFSRFCSVLSPCTSDSPPAVQSFVTPLWTHGAPLPRGWWK